MNLAALWASFTAGLATVKDWTAQMRAVLWFVLVVGIIAGLVIVLPRYDCKALGFTAACDNIERSYEK